MNRCLVPSAIYAKTIAQIRIVEIVIQLSKFVKNAYMVGEKRAYNLVNYGSKLLYGGKYVVIPKRTSVS